MIKHYFPFYIVLVLILCKVSEHKLFQKDIGIITHFFPSYFVLLILCKVLELNLFLTDYWHD